MDLKTVRRGGKIEAIGIVLILLGMAGCGAGAVLDSSSGMISGTLLCVAGFFVFLVGRLM